MTATYVKFETPKEIVERAKELLTMAKDTGRVRKGANETTKSIEKGNAKLVVIAEDVTPIEVVVHIPALCEEKGVTYLYFPTKNDVGAAVGLSVGSAAISVEDAGNGAPLLKEIVEKLGKKTVKAETKEKETTKPEKKKVEEKKSEKVVPEKEKTEKEKSGEVKKE